MDVGCLGVTPYSIRRKGVVDKLGHSCARGVLFVRFVLGLMFFQGAVWRVFELGALEPAS